jgi:hypothetical protein
LPAVPRVTLLFEDAEESPDRGVAGRIRYGGEHFRSGGFTAGVENVHDLSLTAGEVMIVMGWHVFNLVLRI